MSELRRYEILVPLLFNGGRPVPESLLVLTFTELRHQFGAASWETQTLRGEWQHEGVVYQPVYFRGFLVPFRAVTSSRLTRFRSTTSWSSGRSWR